MPTGFWLAGEPLVLASRSKIRQTLLIAAGIPVELCPADLDERGVEVGALSQAPGAVAALLAREKACAVAKLNTSRLILGADQTLALGVKRFTKPADRTAARAQLRALSGRTHELYSAIAFVQGGTSLFEFVGVASMTMRALSDQFLDCYLDVAGAAAITSVGGYQIEGPGIHLFERVEGDYFTVLGLPLIPALDFLRRHGSLAQ
jgi:septum formation protein